MEHVESGRTQRLRRRLPTVAPECKVCGELLRNGRGEAITCVALGGGVKVHTGCFICCVCQQPLAGKEVEHYEHGGAYYCAEDFRASHGKQCSVCSARLLRWSVRGGSAYCPEHEHRLPACVGCERLIAPNSGAKHAGGSVVCSRCSPSSVVDVQGARRVWGQVVSFLAGAGACVPSADGLSLELLERSQLLERNKSKPVHGRHGARQACPLGITRVEQQTEIKTGEIVASSLKVRSVAMMSALPEGLAGATLAHEAGHVFLHLNGFDPRMPDRVAEGICELFSYLWEQSRARGCEGATGAEAEDRRMRMRAMETSRDPVYGAGFRDALAAYTACGCSLPALLARVKDSGGELPTAGGPAVAIWARRSGATSRGRALPSAAPRRARAFDDSRRRGVLTAKARARASSASVSL